ADRDHPAGDLLLLRATLPSARPDFRRYERLATHGSCRYPAWADPARFMPWPGNCRGMGAIVAASDGSLWIARHYPCFSVASDSGASVAFGLRAQSGGHRLFIGPTA